MKTNKSYSKRLKLTRNGKILARKPGKNHFNAKASGNDQMSGKRMANFKMSNKDIGKYLPNTR